MIHITLPEVGERVRVTWSDKVKEGVIEKIHPPGSCLTREQVKEYFDPATFHLDLMNRYEQRRVAEPGRAHLKPYNYDEKVEGSIRARMRPLTSHLYVMRRPSGSLLILPEPCFDPRHKYRCAEVIREQK